MSMNLEVESVYGGDDSIPASFFQRGPYAIDALYNVMFVFSVEGSAWRDAILWLSATTGFTHKAEFPGAHSFTIRSTGTLTAVWGAWKHLRRSSPALATTLDELIYARMPKVWSVLRSQPQ
jgi:hypothetical protein